MRRHAGAIIVLALLLVAAGFIIFRAWSVARGSSNVREDGRDAARSVAVQVAPIEVGNIRDVRTLSGSLEARARFTVATKVGGLLEQISVDIGDEISRGQVIAEIDDAEFVQAVAQAEAELAVRRAELVRAESERDLAQREYDRAVALQERGIASESRLDETRASLASANAVLQLAEARVQQAEAALELARIPLSYTSVTAEWSSGPQTATIAERFQDAGTTLNAGDAVVSVASLDPLKAVVAVTERDYGRLSVGQMATLVTDAYPGMQFDAQVARIAPVFRESSRQARVELTVANPERLLRPGMFIRVRIVLNASDDATIIPVAALVERGDQTLVFVVNDDARTVTAVPVEVGIVDRARAEIVSPPLTGRVVTLGQQLLEDGSAITFDDPAAGEDAAE